jgi:hypothetical protein
MRFISLQRDAVSSLRDDITAMSVGFWGLFVIVHKHCVSSEKRDIVENPGLQYWVARAIAGMG